MSLSWGKITWFLFHTLAEKIKEESFNEKKDDLFKLIFLICSNLPCPECQEHALQTLKLLKINAIKSKCDFKKFIWSFHNIVNRRRKMPMFSYEDCETMYNKAKMENILNNFYIIWGKQYRVMKLMGDTFKRDRCIEYIKKWMANNGSHFDI